MELKEIGVVPAKEHQFAAKGISSVEDLLQFLPRKYKDFSKVTGFLPSDQISCVKLRFDRMKSYPGKRPMVMAFCHVVKTNEKVHVIWFNQAWITKRLSPWVGCDVFVAGKATYDSNYRTYTIYAPDIFDRDMDKMGIYPVYSKIPGMSSDYLTDKMYSAITSRASHFEPLPEDIVAREQEISIHNAFRYLHRPKSFEQIEQGRERILFNDLVYFALHNEWNKRAFSAGSQYNIKTVDLLQKVKAQLPYTLTEDQESTVNAMIADAKAGKRINALVQGDVGCGKTIISLLTAAAFISSGYQVAFMAPTQVLARQHFQTATELLSGLGVKVVFLGGDKLKKAEKDALLASIASGEANLVVGTHAMFSKNVEYAKLALTIADEEHKFGVAQRAALVSKAAEGVHSITMSATPIPRSLAQVIYGNSLQLYTIRTKPAGRMPVITKISSDRNDTYRFILNQVRSGRQIYVVCPMIDVNTDLSGVKSVEETETEYKAALEPYRVRIATLTGRNTKEETADIIARFKKGDVDVLIATTVIEVGVDVPNATGMVVTNAERFGLSGLHQLRGRVGRGKYQSYCILESIADDGKAKDRLNVMCQTTDGFEIAEADLKMRGAGDFLGTRQSGDNKYMSLMMAFPDKYDKAKLIASEIMDRGTSCCPMMERVAREKVVVEEEL